MARYLDEASAAADGYSIVHDEAARRFTLNRDDQVFGEAHYALRDENVIDFDHTFVDPELRGTGLSAILAHHALTSELAQSRTIAASCWFIEGYLAQHPELRTTTPGATEA